MLNVSGPTAPDPGSPQSSTFTVKYVGAPMFTEAMPSIKASAFRPHRSGSIRRAPPLAGAIGSCIAYDRRVDIDPIIGNRDIKVIEVDVRGPECWVSLEPNRDLVGG